MISIKQTKESSGAPKRTITVKGAIVKDLRFADETGDITTQVLAQLPPNSETVDVKISI